MAIAPFLAMTAAEMRNNSVLPAKVAWMACHFSPYGTGLSNLPRELPPGSLLMVDDITPPRGHDPERIAQQLRACVEELHCGGVLLDFQRQGCEETQAIAKHLIQALPCPAAVSNQYADDLDCPVFLPPVPLSVAPEEYLLPWNSHEIWLELGSDGEYITLTEAGTESSMLPYPGSDLTGFAEERLHCHYQIETNEKSTGFTLWRTKEDIEALLKKAENLGVAGTVGLYQEFQK